MLAVRGFITSRAICSFCCSWLEQKVIESPRSIIPSLEVWVALEKQSKDDKVYCRCLARRMGVMDQS